MYTTPGKQQQSVCCLLTRSFYPATYIYHKSVNPVSVLLFFVLERQKLSMWSQTVRQRESKPRTIAINQGKKALDYYYYRL